MHEQSIAAMSAINPTSNPTLNMISIACSTTGGGANGHKVSALGTCIETAKRGRVIKSIKNPRMTFCSGMLDVTID